MMEAQKKDTEYKIIYCKPNDRYYLHGDIPSNIRNKETEIDFSLSLCGNDTIIKDNLTYKQAKDFLLTIYKLKNIKQRRQK